ncbi:MAG: chemotaxis protein CheY [Nevskia sp.]|nr:chemotaxis protein CheY [Nevskia sp.]
MRAVAQVQTCPADVTRSKVPTAIDPLAWLAGSGEVAGLMRLKDWSQTPAGPIEHWPQSLKTALGICLGSRYPMEIWWGPQYLHFYNDAYRPILGASKHPQFIGSPGIEVWGELWHVVGPMLDGVMQTGEATYSEDKQLIMTRNGYAEETYITFSYSPLRDEAGAVAGVFCACSETTGRVLGERRLRILGELGSNAYEAQSAAEACAHTAAILRHNKADIPFAQIYLLDAERDGVTLAATVNLTAQHAAAPAQIDLSANGALWPLREVLLSGAPQLVEGVDTRFGSLPGGPWRESARQALVLPLSGVAQDRLSGFLIVGINPRCPLDAPYRSFLTLVAGHLATAIMRAEAYQAERRRADTLAELNQAKSEFFSNVSHEFRTPLTLILNPLEQLLDQPRNALRNEHSMLISLAHRNGLRLLRLVNTLLDFSRAESGRAEASFEPCDLAALTAGVASSFESLFEHAGLRLEVDCDALAEPVYVDQAMWEKVVLNLLSNAFKFTFEGGVSLCLRDAGAQVELEVRDTGTGIPAVEVPKLFERFHRVAGARGRSFEGSGIGLALVREVVGLHGGTITVASELGRGSTFTVAVPKGAAHLPAESLRMQAQALSPPSAIAYLEEAQRWVQQDTAAESEVGAAAAVLVARPVGARPPRVLLAEDNADMRDLVRRLLETGGYVVETVGDGQAALASLRRSQPDLLLSDVMMPQLDGIGLLRQLRADPKLRELPVILLSARAGNDAQVDALGVGADDYLTKPFSASELLARVSANLTMARLRRSTAQALRDKERQLNTIIHQATVGIVQTDPQGRLLLVNTRFCEIVGRTTEELLGREMQDYSHPDDRPRKAALLARLLEDDQSFIIEKRYLRPDGSAVWVNNHVSLTRHDDGRPQYVIIVVQDVSVRKLAEEERQRLHDTLEQRVAERTGELASVNRQLLEQIEERRNVEAALIQAQKLEAVGQLTSGVAHDFNNLLTVISGNLDFLMRELAHDPQAMRRLGFVRSATERGAKLTGQLLSFSRKQRLLPRAVNLNDVVKGMGDLLRSSIGGTMEVETLLMNELQLALVDPTQLELVIVNLAINARDAMEVGGRIRIETANAHCERPTRPEHPPAGDYVMVAVADSGNGMTPEVLEKAFEPFFTTKEIGKGSGLGLSQVLGLAQQSGGGVRIDTQLGRGTRVSVYLPLAGETVEAVHSREPAIHAAAPADAQVLLVDDDDDVRTITASVLEELGYAVTQANGGREALLCLERDSAIDLMVVDFAMPGMNGREVARQARQRRPGLPIVLITGYADIGQLQAEAVVDYVVQKPFQINELAARIRAALATAAVQ